ncbi:MAG: dihydrolipoamide acetyltransferase family protein [Dehalococcoidia bacterium]|nr:dihydrolipoamide acetyltransferase family protein [Dehalococcoidia bacterium]
MAEYVAIPKLGMAMMDAMLVEWRHKEGEQVNKGDIVLLIETEKTKWEVEANAPGFLHILVPEDTKANVGRVVGLIAQTKDELAALQKEPPKEMYTTAPVPSGAPQEAMAQPASAVTQAPAQSTERVKISPVARKMAEEAMMDITTVRGTGPDGRIVREDIERAITEKATRKEAFKPAPIAATTPSGQVIDFKRVKQTIPLKSTRRAIAEHMHRSLQVAAQLTNMGEIDMSEIVRIREGFVAQEKTIGVRISYTDILVCAICKAIKANPVINSSLIENNIILWEDINIGVAVAVGEGAESGLIVPVVRNADKKSLVELSQEIKALTEKARTGKLLPDDVSGGTFTLTNLGAVGGGYGFGTPIINQPQAAILASGAISDRAVVRSGQIVIRPILTYSFTYDHRVIDGAPAARFTMHLAQLLENPAMMLL